MVYEQIMFYFIDFLWIIRNIPLDFHFSYTVYIDIPSIAGVSIPPYTAPILPFFILTDILHFIRNVGRECIPALQNYIIGILPLWSDRWSR